MLILDIDELDYFLLVLEGLLGRKGAAVAHHRDIDTDGGYIEEHSFA